MKKRMESSVIKDILTVKLDRYQDIEMILLKGHLVLEQAVNSLIGMHVEDPKNIDSMGLMFDKKIKLLAALMGQQFPDLYRHLRRLNRIRNKMAHEVFFDKYHKDLKLWACAVNGYTPKTLNNKRTYKNSVIKAFSFLAGYLVGLERGKRIAAKLK